MTRFLWAAALALVCVSATSVHATEWVVDGSRSTLGFSGTQTGEPFSGRFRTWTARIEFDAAHPDAARLHVEVDVASATTGDPQKDAAMPDADWLDAARFAHAVFDAQGFMPKGAGAYATTGTLSLRGVARPVTLPFTLFVAGGEAHAAGHATLTRTDFGVGQGQWADGGMVGLDVGVDIDLFAAAK